MKKTLLKILAAAVSSAAAVVCMTISTFAYSAGIDDQAGIYTSEQIAELEARQQEVADHTGWNIAVVTTDDGFGTDGYNAIEYAEAYYDKTFGYSSSGILYLIDVDYRHFCISGEADYKYFDDNRVRDMSNTCEKYYFDYDDVGNLNAFYDKVEYYYDKGPFTSDGSAESAKIRFNFGAAAIVGLIAAAIGVGVVWSRYKFHYQPTANNYLDGSRINFYRRTDRFVREFTTKAKIESSSGGGGGGGSHGSSGGHSHGGGGGGGRR